MLHAVLRLISPIYIALMLMVLAYVVRFGGRDERAGIVTIVVGSFLTGYAASPHGVWRGSEIGILVVDIGVLVAFVIIMALSNRFWPIWVTALQTIAVMTHIARILRPSTVPIAYAFAEQIWAYVMLLILVIVSTRLRTRQTVKHQTMAKS